MTCWLGKCSYVLVSAITGEYRVSAERAGGLGYILGVLMRYLAGILINLSTVYALVPMIAIIVSDNAERMTGSENFNVSVYIVVTYRAEVSCRIAYRATGRIDLPVVYKAVSRRGKYNARTAVNLIRASIIVEPLTATADMVLRITGSGAGRCLILNSALSRMLVILYFLYLVTADYTGYAVLLGCALIIPYVNRVAVSRIAA